MKSEIISIEDWVLPSGTIPAVRDRNGYLKRLREANAKLKDPNELLLTWGFHHYFHNKLTRADLDKISSTRPIIVWHRSCHEFILNSVAMKKYGLTRKFFAKQDKSAQEQSNLKEGHFWEQGAMAALTLIGSVIARPERMQEGLKFTENYLHANGVTLASEPGGFLSKPLQDMENAVLGDADTPFRFYFIPDGKTLADRYIDGDLIGETEKIKDIKIWGTVHEGRILPIKKQKGTKKISHYTPVNQTPEKSTAISDNGVHGHDHDHHIGCACTLNRRLAAIFLKMNQ